MKNKTVFTIIVSFLIGLVIGTMAISVKALIPQPPVQPNHQFNNPYQGVGVNKLATVIYPAFLSARANDLYQFYELQVNQRVTVQYQSGNFYFVQYYTGCGGVDPISGWADKNDFLLDEDIITP